MRDTSSNSDAQRYSSATITSLSNEAQREIVNQTWLSYKTTEYALLPRTTFYNLPTDAINILQVDFKRPGQAYFQLDEVSREGVGDNNTGWESLSGTPSEYFVRQSSFSSAAGSYTQQISYLPIPALPSSTGTVRIWYTNQVDDLSADSDVPFNGKTAYVPYHMSIVYYVTMRLKAIEGRLEEAKFYAELYGLALKTINDRAFQHPNYKPGSRTSLNR